MHDLEIRLNKEEDEMVQGLEITLEEDSKDKKLEADILWKHFLNEDKLLLFRDCLRQKDLKGLLN